MSTDDWAADYREVPPGVVKTPTGVVIGGAYRRPAPQPSADEERLQAALLAHPVSYPACTLDRCQQDASRCPCPTACELPEGSPQHWLLQLVGRVVRRR